MSGGPYRAAGKRAVDIVAGSLSIVILSPILLVAAAAIKLEDGGKVIFRQRRIGRDGHDFTILKFRSMPENTRDVPSASAETLKITRTGRFLRRSNIDELPQLWNIVRGDMSIVGPRPALPAQTALVALRRTNGAIACTPGLTGLAQVNAHSGMSEEQKAAFDGQYAARITLLKDAAIVVRTIGYLFHPPPVY